MDIKQRSHNVKARLEATLHPFVQDVAASFGLAGLAIGIVKSGELVYAQGFGVRNLDTQEPVTPRSLFHLASVSKPFVATAIVQLVEQGKLALDAPIIAYLPYFLLKDPRSKDITVQQLLSHTSGMPDEVDYHWYAPEDDEGALERYVRFLDATWDAIEMHRAEAVMPLLKLWIALQPDAALAHEMLGWAYIIQGGRSWPPTIYAGRSLSILKARTPRDCSSSFLEWARWGRHLLPADDRGRGRAHAGVAGVCCTG